MLLTTKLTVIKFVSLAAAIFFLTGNLHSQEFSFVLTFEDAVGNQDSLILGYGSEASDGIDPDFGEKYHSCGLGYGIRCANHR